MHVRTRARGAKMIAKNEVILNLRTSAFRIHIHIEGVYVKPSLIFKKMFSLQKILNQIKRHYQELNKQLTKQF